VVGSSRPASPCPPSHTTTARAHPHPRPTCCNLRARTQHLVRALALQHRASTLRARLDLGLRKQDHIGCHQTSNRAGSGALASVCVWDHTKSNQIGSGGCHVRLHAKQGPPGVPASRWSEPLGSPPADTRTRTHTRTHREGERERENTHTHTHAPASCSSEPQVCPPAAQAAAALGGSAGRGLRTQPPPGAVGQGLDRDLVQGFEYSSWLWHAGGG
jgi:hypothetical protein